MPMGIGAEEDALVVIVGRDLLDGGDGFVDQLGDVGVEFCVARPGGTPAARGGVWHYQGRMTPFPPPSEHPSEFVGSSRCRMYCGSLSLKTNRASSYLFCW